MQAVLSAFGELPGGHLVQEVAPVLFEKVPTGHSLHFEAPSLEYVPKPHRVQVL